MKTGRNLFLALAILLTAVAPAFAWIHASSNTAQSSRGDEPFPDGPDPFALGTLAASSRSHRPNSRGLQTSLAPGKQNVALIGQLGGITIAAAVDGNLVYAGVGPRMLILDATTPSSPTAVGQTEVLPGFVWDVALAGGFAYVGVSGAFSDDNSSLRVFDVSNPASPVEVGFLDTLGDVASVALAGNYVYVGDFAGGLHVVDISNPANPVKVGFLGMPNQVYGVTVLDG
jgi:hypothetical protein